MIIVSLFFFSWINVFSMENFKIFSSLGPLQRMSHMKKHVSKAGKVDPGDRVTLPVKFACKPELTLTCLVAWVTLAQG